MAMVGFFSIFRSENPMKILKTDKLSNISAYSKNTVDIKKLYEKSKMLIFI